MRQADTPAEVHRLGRRPDPWAWPDWAYAEPDGTFGNRYDDPQGIYRVLYASTQRVATFVECLAYYRADIELVAELQAIVGDEGDALYGRLLESGRAQQERRRSGAEPGQRALRAPDPAQGAR